MTTVPRAAALVIFGVLAAPATAQDFDAGFDAARAGDYETALENWRPLAEAGDAAAQFNLGLMYDNGQGVTQDYAAAVRWYRLAAEQGFDAAQSNLGVMYYNGDGVLQDYAEAVRWYRLAAEQGHAAVQFNLGVAYFEGDGVAEDNVLAHMWYNIASANGVERAAGWRTVVENRMTREQVADARARVCMASEYQECD